MKPILPVCGLALTALLAGETLANGIEGHYRRPLGSGPRSDVLHLDRSSEHVPTNSLAPFPPPTGPYAVGAMSRLLTDPSRANRYVETNGSFMVSIWYPGQPEPGLSPSPYMDP